VNLNLTLLGQMISFFIFVWFCMKYVWPPIIKVMEDRQAKIAAGLRDAERAEHDLKQAQQKGHDLIEEARSQAAKLIEHANKRANQLVEEARDQAQEEAQRIKTQAELDMVQQVNAARESLRQQVAGLAVLGAERVLERQVTQRDHDQLLLELAQEL
jgi:F-type H+-transporting ATPase subunit b